MRTLVKRGRQLADWVILERKMYTILTVEDDLHINNLLKEALGKAGYACSQAFSGTEALLWLERNECQLILLDLMLPGLSGEEVLQQIRQTSNGAGHCIDGKRRDGRKIGSVDKWCR